MRILFILHEYFPAPSAITNCIEPLISKFKEEGIQISILTRKNQRYLPNKETLNAIKIYRIADYYSIINDQLERNTNTIVKLFYKIVRKLFLLNKKNRPNNEKGLLNKSKAVNLGKKIIKKEKCDCIISVSYPFITHQIANMLIKNTNIKWIAYQCDPHTLNYTFNNEIDRRMKEEINCLKKSDIIFLSEENYRENIKIQLSELKSKYYVLPFPIIKDPKLNNKINSNKIFKFVYTGTLYANLREPFHMLDFFSKTDLNYILDMYFFAEENINLKLKLYKKNMGDKLNLFKNATKNECQKALEEADFILNIGNNVPNQLPSKIYEAIQYGKPIVNFYCIKNDTSKMTLDKYPLAISIKLPNERNQNKFVKFCKENKNKKIAYEDIIKIYPSAEIVAAEFYKKVKYIYENKKNSL